MPYVHTSEETHDAIVVGSGITGGWAAKELCEKGLDVLLLERGRRVEHGDYPTEHMPAWEMPYRQRGDRELYEEEYEHQHHCYAFGEGTRHFFVNDKKHPYNTPDGGRFRWIRGYHLGGRSITWGRLCYRWSDLDFGANMKDGHGVDWPIRYEDVAPWYSYVEKHVGISGSKEGLPQVPDGEFLPPMDMNCAERKVRDGIGQARFADERRLIIGRAAVLTEQHKGRAPCHYCGPCHRGCSTGSYFSSLSSTLPAAAQTGNLTIACDSVVTEVLYDRDAGASAGGGGKGRATGVRVVDRLTKERREHEANLVFLCASTLGSTQIMLNSTSARFPQGLGNDSGALGHYLMDHPIGGGATGTVPGLEDKFYRGHRPNVVYIPRFRNLDGPASDDLGFVRGYGLQGAASREPWRRGANEAGLGKSLKQKLRRPGPWKISLGGNGEMLPRKENRIELSGETDEWGLPLIEVYCEFGENEAHMREDAKTQAAETLEAAGCRDVETYMRDHPPGHNIHEMGTARMGRDPKTSVLNGWNQVHAVPNVFVTDGSCMASSACQNPSITYMALTARAADYAVKQLKKRNL